MKTATRLTSRCRTWFLFVPMVLGQSASAEDEVDVASWYPRTVTSDQGTVVIHAPQVDAWPDFESLDAWVAFDITRTASDSTHTGSVHFVAATDTDVQSREVLLHDIEIKELTITGLDAGSEEHRLVSDALRSKSRTVPLDLVLEYLPADTTLASAEGLNTAPPQIFVATGPALLLSIDTEPVWVPVGEGDLMFVINTNWDVLRVDESGPAYFCHQGAWLSSAELAGPWHWADSLPAEFADLPDGATWANTRSCLPGDLEDLSPPASEPPVVHYSQKQAELLMLEGEPDWQPIGDLSLEYAANTEQDLFRTSTGVYLLLSGRWFEASGLAGPWVLAADLPEVFGEIPPADSADAHEKSYVRSSIPGTREAWEAALVASIPRKAEIQRGSESALDLNVDYAGDPVFTRIPTTEIDMAVNTTYQVFRYQGAYYLCHNATWLTGFGAEGPWTFADSIPAEFAAIPPSSPAYNVTFVTIDGSDEASIDYSYTSGYEGAYVTDETVVYGTGYASPAVTLTLAYGFYDGWFGYPYYPYYPWPPTYGYGSWYDPDTGRYGEAVVGYGPFGAAGGAAVYNPETGVYARGQAIWDNDELAGRGYAYNPNTNTSIARNRYVDFEDKEGWSQSVARRGDEWRYSESEWEDGRMTTEFESSYGTSGEVTRERQGDTIVSEGTISGENRSATFQGEYSDGQYTGQVQGSEGGTGTVDRELDDGTITGGGTFEKGGQTVDTNVKRTAEGVAREIETGTGGQGVTLRSGDDNAFAYQTGAGDVYAGRDGNVYKKTDDGWTSVESPRSRTEPLPDSGFATSAREPSRTDTTRYDLERDYRSRQRGFDRYARYQSAGRTRNSSPNRRRRR